MKSKHGFGIELVVNFMSEEFLARQDSDLYWFFIVVAIAFVLFAIGRFTGKSKSGVEQQNYRMWFWWAGVCIFAVYFFLTIPYTGYFFDFGRKLDPPASITSTNQIEKYLQDHHKRIEVLESQVKESREQLRELRDHYSHLMQLLMTAILAFGFSRIFSPIKRNDPDKEETPGLS